MEIKDQPKENGTKLPVAAGSALNPCVGRDSKAGRGLGDKGKASCVPSVEVAGMEEGSQTN